MFSMDHTGSLSLTIPNKKANILPYQCRICYAPARYSNFGVISCSSCKMFFKRNAQSQSKIPKCQFAGQCEINMDTRHICTACRLDKCFACGMSTDYIRGPTKRQSNTKKLVKIAIRNQTAKFPTLNLLESDSSLLTFDQWTLLSNLYNNYQESKLLKICQLLIDNNSHIRIEWSDTMYDKLVKDFLSSTYETTGIYIRLNDDLCNLSANDRSIMIRNAADHVSCIGCSFIMYYCHLFSLEAFTNVIKKLYGQHTVDLHLSAMKYIDSDIALIKLAFALFAFSEITYLYDPLITNDLTNSINIFKIQINMLK